MWGATHVTQRCPDTNQAFASTFQKDIEAGFIRTQDVGRQAAASPVQVRVREEAACRGRRGGPGALTPLRSASERPLGPCRPGAQERGWEEGEGCPPSGLLGALSGPSHVPAAASVPEESSLSAPRHDLPGAGVRELMGPGVCLA